MGKYHDKPEVDRAIAALLAEGWRIRELGHRYYLLCPCGDPRGRIRVDNSPQNPGNHARRMLREAKHCPNRHDLDGQAPTRGSGQG